MLKSIGCKERKNNTLLANTFIFCSLLFIKKGTQDSRMPFQDENTLTYDEYPDWRGTQNLYNFITEVSIEYINNIVMSHAKNTIQKKSKNVV